MTNFPIVAGKFCWSHFCRARVVYYSAVCCGMLHYKHGKDCAGNSDPGVAAAGTLVATWTNVR